MTKREFAALFYRLLGVYTAINGFAALAPLGGTAALMLAPFWGGGMGGGMGGFSAILFYSIPSLLLQVALGVILYSRARFLAAVSVGPEEGGPMNIDSITGRLLIVWGIGIYLMVSNLPNIAAALGKFVLDSAPMPGARGMGTDWSYIFSSFAKSLIGVYMFLFSSAKLRQWRPQAPLLAPVVPHPREWGRDPQTPVVEPLASKTDADA